MNHKAWFSPLNSLEGFSMFMSRLYPRPTELMEVGEVRSNQNILLLTSSIAVTYSSGPQSEVPRPTASGGVGPRSLCFTKPSGDSETHTEGTSTVLEVSDLGCTCQLLTGLPASSHTPPNPLFIL